MKSPWTTCERSRGHERRAGPLHTADDDQHDIVLREPRQHRRQKRDHRHACEQFAQSFEIDGLLSVGSRVLGRTCPEREGAPAENAGQRLFYPPNVAGWDDERWLDTATFRGRDVPAWVSLVALAVGGFGNFVMPLQIGAPDMAFPKINMASYWVYFIGGVVMLTSFFIPGGAAQSGWTSYPPLSVITATDGQTMWLIGMIFLITSSLLGSINFIVTIVQLRAKGMSFMRLPFFVWAQFVTSFLLLLAFPPLEAAGVLQLMDKVAGTSFFLPSGLVVSGQVLNVAGGGNPILWQHLFWFLAHPEVYVLILPAMGIVAEIIANNTRKPLWGYKALVYSAIFLGFMSFIVWAHHMFTVGMPLGGELYFMYATMLIAIPTGVKVFNWVSTMWRGSLSFETPMLWAISFVILFTIGGFSGLMLAIVPADFQYHDTYFVVAHFHYVLVTGALFGIIAAVYYWWPKWTGRMYNETLGKFHFWWSVVFVNLLFFPQHFLGLAGMPRRIPDYNAVFADWNMVSSIGAFGMFITPFLMGFILWRSLKTGVRAEARAWEGAKGLEWTVPSPAPHHTFTTPPVIRDGDLAHGDFAHADYD